MYTHARLHTCTNHVQCILALFTLLPFSFSRLPVWSGCTRFSKPQKRSRSKTVRRLQSTRPFPSSIFVSRCMMYHRPAHPEHDRARAARMRSSDSRSIDVGYDFNTKKPLNLLRISGDSDRLVERSAGTGGQRHRRSGDRRDSLQRLLSPAQDRGAATGLVGVASCKLQHATACKGYSLSRKTAALLRGS